MIIRRLCVPSYLRSCFELFLQHPGRAVDVTKKEKNHRKANPWAPVAVRFFFFCFLIFLQLLQEGKPIAFSIQIGVPDSACRCHPRVGIALVLGTKISLGHRQLQALSGQSIPPLRRGHPKATKISARSLPGTTKEDQNIRRVVRMALWYRHV